MKNIEVYGTSNCIWCDRAKALLTRRNYRFSYIDIHSEVYRAEMIDRMSRNDPISKLNITVPQIFVEGLWVGGFQELAVADANGSLQQIIAGE